MAEDLPWCRAKHKTVTQAIGTMPMPVLVIGQGERASVGIAFVPAIRIWDCGKYAQFFSQRVCISGVGPWTGGAGLAIAALALATKS